MDPFPDLGSLSDQELKDLIDQMTDEELEVSYRRRILHGKIDILRAELVNRLRKKREGGEDVITGADVEKLTRSWRARSPPRPTSSEGARRVALHCPECGFVNAEGANYCQKCGAFMAAAAEAPSGDRTTITYAVDDATGELKPVDVEKQVEAAGAALVIRSGGGRVGESIALDDEHITIGRRPDSTSSSTT